MECCLAPKRKNKPPLKDYQPDEPQLTIDRPPADEMAKEFQRQKLERLTKVKVNAITENIPPPPRSLQVTIAM
jgi:hypothetical protein